MDDFPPRKKQKTTQEEVCTICFDPVVVPVTTCGVCRVCHVCMVSLRPEVQLTPAAFGEGATLCEARPFVVPWKCHLCRTPCSPQFRSVQKNAPEQDRLASTVSCPYCEFSSSVYSEFLEHANACPRASIACPNGCGTVFRGRRQAWDQDILPQVQKHLRTSCPRLKCPGCNFRGHPRDVDRCVRVHRYQDTFRDTRLHRAGPVSDEDRSNVDSVELALGILLSCGVLHTRGR